MPTEKKPIVNIRKSLFAVVSFALFALLLFVVSNKAAPGAAKPLPWTALLESAYADIAAGRYDEAIDRVDRAARLMEERRFELEAEDMTAENEARLATLLGQERQANELRKHAELVQEAQALNLPYPEHLIQREPVE
jgi:hypothetical protein